MLALHQSGWLTFLKLTGWKTLCKLTEQGAHLGLLGPVLDALALGLVLKGPALGRKIQKSMRLKYEPSSEPLHISVK